jgi:cytosine/adenosine deaminase-related metal-dependent hydrolase
MFLSADKIHNGHQFLPENTLLEIDESGVIVAVLEGGTIGEIQHFEGILCPGFVNVHCHLELSHLKGAISEKTGLTSFLQQVVGLRNQFSEEQKLWARNKAFQEMLDNGIVALGDIANTSDTLSLREKDMFHWQTFVESIGFAPERAAHSFDIAQKILIEFEGQIPQEKTLQQSIVPHAPYSVSADLLQLISSQSADKIISIHNQESAAENELYQSKTGAFIDFLQSMGIDTTAFVASGKNSLATYGECLPQSNSTILVHNTFTEETDIEFAQSKFPKLFWCLCPNANLYIENRLPNINLLLASNAVICIGTDSLASNHQLSVMAELLTIKQQFPEIAWEKLLTWATYNGACALQMQEHIGSFEAGKRPGIVQIKNDHSFQKLY